MFCCVGSIEQWQMPGSTRRRSLTTSAGTTRPAGLWFQAISLIAVLGSGLAQKQVARQQAIAQEGLSATCLAATDVLHLNTLRSRHDFSASGTLNRLFGLAPRRAYKEQGPNPKSKAAAKPNANADSKLAAENRRLVAENKRLAANGATTSGTAGKPPSHAAAPKAAPTKAVKDCEERLRYAQGLAELYPDEHLYATLVAKHQADLDAIRPVKVVQTSELQLELEDLAAQIQKDKDRWAKKKREEEKLQR